MIRYALTEEKDRLQEIWHDAFAFDDGGFTDFFFTDLYDKGQHYVLTQEEKIAAIASVFKHDFMIGGRRLKVSMIAGVTTLPPYRNQGLMSSLLKEILDQLSRQDLLTMIQAYDSAIYQKFGFETVYHRRRYYFNYRGFNYSSTDGIKDEIVTTDLLKIYRRFTRLFSGYKIRNTDYFETMLRGIKAQNQMIRIVYDSNGNPKGYFIYERNTKQIIIHECLYLDARTLNKILSYCLAQRENVIIYLSEYERIERLYPGVAYDTSDYTMVRVNDYQLFNKLFKSEITDPLSAMTIDNKPLFMHEEI